MPKFLEQKLKSEYGANSKIPYKVMNSIGAMRGNKETAKGAAMEAKHERKMHPEMTQRAAMVAASHAHLAASVPNFNRMPARPRMQAVQNHVRSRMGK
jgi:hypothetical protein